MERGTLHLFCGKMGSGKSTLASKLAADADCVLLSEDVWLADLYPNLIKTVADYHRYSTRIKPKIQDIVHILLSKNIDVVMDFPANTKQQRRWLLALAQSCDAAHVLYYLDVPDHICLERIKLRAEKDPSRRATDTEDMYWSMTEFFALPHHDEGLIIQVI